MEKTIIENSCCAPLDMQDEEIAKRVREERRIPEPLCARRSGTGRAPRARRSASSSEIVLVNAAASSSPATGT